MLWSGIDHWLYHFMGWKKDRKCESDTCCLFGLWWYTTRSGSENKNKKFGDEEEECNQCVDSERAK